MDLARKKKMKKKGDAGLKTSRLKPKKRKANRTPRWKTGKLGDRPAPTVDAMVINNQEKGGADRRQADFFVGQKVVLLISARSERGFIALINGTHKGILYKNEVFQPLKIGQEIEGFIKKVREDKKIDLCLQKPGYKAIIPLSRKIMDRLQEQGGFIPVTDKSRPKYIADLFGISKKTYKKAIGHLYKRRLITLEKHGVRVRERSDGTPTRNSGVRYRKTRMWGREGRL